MYIDAPECTLNSLTSLLIPVREIGPATVFVFKNVSLFSWNDFVQFPLVPVLHNVESTVDANPLNQVRSDCDHFWVLAGKPPRR